MDYDHWLRAEKGLGTSHYYGFQGKRRGGGGKEGQLFSYRQHSIKEGGDYKLPIDEGKSQECFTALGGIR